MTEPLSGTAGPCAAPVVWSNLMQPFGDDLSYLLESACRDAPISRYLRLFSVHPTTFWNSEQSESNPVRRVTFAPSFAYSAMLSFRHSGTLRPLASMTVDNNRFFYPCGAPLWYVRSSLSPFAIWAPSQGNSGVSKVFGTPLSRWGLCIRPPQSRNLARCHDHSESSTPQELFLPHPNIPI